MPAIVSIYLDKKVLEKHLLPSIPDDITERHFIEGTKPANMAALYNRVLGETESRFVIFAHPDVEFNPEVIRKMVQELERGSGAVGLVGVSGPGRYEFSNNLLEPKEVVTLDSCLIAVDKRKGIHFDETTFDELHLYVEDFCLSTRSAGFKCLVVPAKHFFHASSTLTKCGACWGKYAMYRKRLVDKWKWRFGNGIATT